MTFAGKLAAMKLISRKMIHNRVSDQGHQTDLIPADACCKVGAKPPSAEDDGVANGGRVDADDADDHVNSDPDDVTDADSDTDDRVDNAASMESVGVSAWRFSAFPSPRNLHRRNPKMITTAAIITDTPTTAPAKIP